MVAELSIMAFVKKLQHLFGEAVACMRQVAAAAAAAAAAIQCCERRNQPALLQNERGFENIDVFAGDEKNWQNLC